MAKLRGSKTGSIGRAAIVSEPKGECRESLVEGNAIKEAMLRFALDNTFLIEQEQTKKYLLEGAEFGYLLAQESNWVRVEDGLPEAYTKVLICDSHERVFKGVIESNGWQVYYADGMAVVSKEAPITHWQYLPTPPAK